MADDKAALATDARAAAADVWGRDELPPGWWYDDAPGGGGLVFVTPQGVATREDPRDNFDRYALAFAAAAAGGVDVRAFYAADAQGE